MDWHFKFLSPLVISSFTLVSCNNFSSPQHTLMHATKFIDKDNLQGFKSNLTGDALEKFGDESGFDAVKNRIKSKNIKYGQPVLESEDGDYLDHVAYYNVPILDKSTHPANPLMRATVECRSHMMGEGGAMHTAYFTNCKIAELSLLN